MPSLTPSRRAAGLLTALAIITSSVFVGVPAMAEEVPPVEIVTPNVDTPADEVPVEDVVPSEEIVEDESSDASALRVGPVEDAALVAPVNDTYCPVPTQVLVSSLSALDMSESRLGAVNSMTRSGLALSWHQVSPTPVGGPSTNPLYYSKAAWYYAVDFPLEKLGTTSIDFRSSQRNGASVGENYKISINGAWVGNLVKEPSFPLYWATFDVPGMADGPNPSYQYSYGSIQDFLDGFANNGVTNARVSAIGGSGGSGSEGSGVVVSQTAGCLQLNYLKPAPVQVTPTAPGEYVASHDFPMSWTDPVDGNYYEIYSTQVEPAPGTVEIVAPIGGGLDNLTNPYNIAGVQDGTFWWQVRAKDNYGNLVRTGPWSVISKVTVDTTAPTVPTNLDPSGYTMATGYSWSASSDANPVTYEVNYSNTGHTDANGMLDDSATLTAGITGTSLARAFIPGGSWWQVRAKDAAGNYSPWANSVVNYIGVPQIQTPTDNEVITVDTTTVTWTASAGIGGVSEYRVKFRFDTDDDGIIDDEAVERVAGNLTTLVYPLPTQGKWTVEVRAVYNYPLTAGIPSTKLGPWSDRVKFTHDSIAPVAPVLTGPADGQPLSNSTPTLTWNVGGDAVKYQVRTNTTGNVGAGGQLTNPVLANETTTDLFLTLSTQPEGTLYWQVRGIDANGNKGAWSAPWSFEVDTIAPDVTIQRAPGDGSYFNRDFALLRWYAVVGAAEYQLRASTFSSTNANGRLNGADAQSSPRTSGLWSPILNLDEGLTYWQVRAIDAAGNIGPWSDVWSIGVDTVKPVAPTQLTPTTGIPSTVTNPTLTWSAVDATRYQVRTATENSTNARGRLNGANAASTAVGASLQKALTGLPVGSLYWQVRAIDAVGNVGPWSTVWSIVVVAPAVTPPTVTPPAPPAPAAQQGAPAADDTLVQEELETEAVDEESTDDAEGDLPTEAAPAEDPDTELSVDGGIIWWPWAAGLLAILAALGIVLIRRRTNSQP